jgi:hypothetical protein
MAGAFSFTQHEPEPHRPAPDARLPARASVRSGGECKIHQIEIEAGQAQITQIAEFSEASRCCIVLF